MLTFDVFLTVHHFIDLFQITNLMHSSCEGGLVRRNTTVLRS